MHHSEQKCSHFCSEWCIVEYGTVALWDLWMRSICSWIIAQKQYKLRRSPRLHNCTWLRTACICFCSWINVQERSGNVIGYGYWLPDFWVKKCPSCWFYPSHNRSMKSADLFGLVTDYRGRVCNEFLGVVGPIKVVRWQVSSVWRLLMKDATSTWIVANCFVILIFFDHLTVVQWLMDKNEERTWSKQPIFCRRHFQINLLVWKLLWCYFNSNFNEKCSNGPIHYDDVIMSAIASQITSLTIVYSIVYSDKENIKAPRHWPLCGEFTGDRWIPRTNGKLRGKCFHLMTSSCNKKPALV